MAYGVRIHHVLDDLLNHTVIVLFVILLDFPQPVVVNEQALEIEEVAHGALLVVDLVEVVLILRKEIQKHQVRQQLIIKLPVVLRKKVLLFCPLDKII